MLLYTSYDYICVLVLLHRAFRKGKKIFKRQQLHICIYTLVLETRARIASRSREVISDALLGDLACSIGLVSKAERFS
jgi:hypothetical protein